MRVTTRNSIYHLNTIAKTWERVLRTGKSGELRTESGTYLEIPQLEVGHSMAIICVPINEHFARMLITSPVEHIEEQGDEPSPLMVSMIEAQINGLEN